MADGAENHDGSSSSRPNPPGNTASQWSKLVEVIMERKIFFAQWVTRLFTLIFGVLFLIPLPIFGNVTNYYYKALLAAAATSAFRLHQRLPRPALSRQFIAELLMEDSCHYLFYCIIFLYCQPITLSLLPIELFAILHFASFSLQILDALGRNNVWIGRIFISIVELQTTTILRMAAASEIMLLIFTAIYTIAGRTSILIPFVYYRFVTLRYASRRNHYTRTMFAELRVEMERISYSSRCPRSLGAVIRKSIAVVSSFAPTVYGVTN